MEPRRFGRAVARHQQVHPADEKEDGVRFRGAVRVALLARAGHPEHVDAQGGERHVSPESLGIDSRSMIRLRTGASTQSARSSASSRSLAAQERTCSASMLATESHSQRLFRAGDSWPPTRRHGRPDWGL